MPIAGSRDSTVSGPVGLQFESANARTAARGQDLPNSVIQPTFASRDVRLLRNGAASAYFTSACTTDVEMTKPARRLKAKFLAGGFGSRLYTVTPVASKTIGRYSHIDACLLA